MECFTADEKPNMHTSLRLNGGEKQWEDIAVIFFKSSILRKQFRIFIDRMFIVK